MIQSCVIAFSMYSKIPMPRVEWNEKNMKYAFCFFPCVGAVIGLLIWGVGGVLYSSAVSKAFRAISMTLIPIVVTGGIHMDGFLDTVDALSSYGEPEKRLEILKDPRSGAFAVIGCATYLLWNVGVWMEAGKELLPVIACGFVLSRAFSGLAVVWFKLAKNTGLAAAFQDGAKRKRVGIVMVLYILVTGIIMVSFNPVYGSLGILAALVSFLYHRYNCYRNFGGITGDLAGYFLQICELMILTVIVLGAKVC